MKRIFATLFIWILFGFFFAWNDQYRPDMERLISKKRFLVKCHEGHPKIIIAGGSNAFFGLSSKTIEQKLGAPVINISLPAEGIDPRLMRTISLNAAEKGDILVYSSMGFWARQGRNEIEAASLARSLHLDEYVKKQTPGSRQLFRIWKPFPEESNPVTTFVSLAFPSITKYERNMDDHGDYVGCSHKSVKPLKYKGDADQKEFTVEMRVFAKSLREKGVLFVNIAPWILIDPKEESFWRHRFDTVLQNISPEDYRLSRGEVSSILRKNSSEFCDEPTHPNRYSAIFRSDEVVSHLKERLSQQAKSS